MDCLKPITLTKNLERPVTVGCGKCYLCRIQKRREWTMRMIHENYMHEDSVFLTLTYRDEELPMSELLYNNIDDRVKNDKEVLDLVKDMSMLENPNYDLYTTLRKTDIQKFFKRLRNMGLKVRYFACGEYGDKSHRPHYHAIVFGLSLNDEDKLKVIEAWPYADWDNEAILKGSFGIVTDDSIRYVAQYVDKKLSGDQAISEYYSHGKENVFSVMSKGIGKAYVDEYSEDIYDKQKITIKGKEQSFPRYYIKRLGLENSSFRKDGAVEKSRKEVKKMTGKDMSFDEFYKVNKAEDIIKLDKAIKQKRIQKEKNLQTKASMFEKKL